MRTYLVAFVLAFLASWVLTPTMRWLAHRFGLVDSPTEARKVHTLPIPRVGGVAIVVSFLVPILALFCIDNDVSAAYLGDLSLVLGLVGGAIATMLLGLADDLFDLRARYKLVGQIAIAGVAVYLGYDIPVIVNPIGPDLVLGFWSMPLSLIWIVGVMNAINLIDGLDGLAGGVSLFTVLTLMIVGLAHGNVIVALTSIGLAGALLGFLRYNYNPASIFMGDSGSLTLGFILAVTAISGSAKSHTAVALIVPILALSLPLLDTSMSIVRRIAGGRPVFSADRGHVHHRLLDMGLGHRQVVRALYVFCALCGALAMSLVFSNDLVSAVILVVYGLLLTAFGIGSGLVDLHELRTAVNYGFRRKRRVHKNLLAIQAAVDAIRASKTQEETMQAIEQLAGDVSIDEIHVHLDIADREVRQNIQRSWCNPKPAKRASLLPAKEVAWQVIEHPMCWQLGEIHVSGALRLVWHCDEDTLQLPEAPAYGMVALALRDRTLQLQRQEPTVVLRGVRGGAAR